MILLLICNHVTDLNIFWFLRCHVWISSDTINKQAATSNVNRGILSNPRTIYKWLHHFMYTLQFVNNKNKMVLLTWRKCSANTVFWCFSVPAHISNRPTDIELSFKTAGIHSQVARENLGVWVSSWEKRPFQTIVESQIPRPLSAKVVVWPDISIVRYLRTLLEIDVIKLQWS